MGYGSANGMLRLEIRDTTGKSIWIIALAYYRGAKLKYGEVPQKFTTVNGNGNENSAKQQFPKTGPPAKLVEGKIYSLYSQWQYDDIGGAGSEGQTQYFKIQNKQIVIVENPNPTPPPKKPSDK